MTTPPGDPKRPAPAPPGPTRAEIEAYARDSARRHGIPEDIGVRQVFAESSFRANPPSPPGVMGPMQVKPSTAAKYKLDPHDWRQNIDAGFAYDQENLKQFGGDLAQMASAYNGGPYNVRGAPKTRTKDAQGIKPGTYPYVAKLLPGWKPGTDQRFIAPGFPGGPPISPAQPPAAAPGPLAPPPAPPAPPAPQSLLPDPSAPAVFTHQTPWGDVWPLLPAQPRRRPGG